MGTGQDKYAGKTSNAPPAMLANFLDVPARADTFREAILALESCDQVVENLLERAYSGGASSRLVIQYEVIALIGQVFTEVSVLSFFTFLLFCSYHV
jgi:hypothetical protein